jgi:hypothetical protein
VDTLLVVLGVLSWIASLNCIWAVARRHERIVQEQLRNRVALSYVCGCTHPFGYHDRVTGACHGFITGPNEYFGGPIGPRSVACRCLVYAGVVPPEYVLPGPIVLPVPSEVDREY